MEEVGFGAYQLLKLFLCGGIFLAEGAEMLIMGCSKCRIQASKWACKA